MIDEKILSMSLNDDEIETKNEAPLFIMPPMYPRKYVGGKLREEDDYVQNSFSLVGSISD